MKIEPVVGLIQISCTLDTSENYERTIVNIKKAASQGANIVCTQELFKSQYFCQVANTNNFNLAEKINEDSPTIKDFSALAKELGIVIVAALFEKQAPGIYYNSAVVIDADGSFLGKYRKMHIPEDPYYYEKFYFIPGDLGYKVFKTRYANIGVLICWDQWFPEAARLTAMKGADLIFYPTAIGHSPYKDKSEGDAICSAWQVVQKGHAVANGCYIAAVNRVGYEENPEGKGGIDFWGQSFVADPYGRVLKEASEKEEEILICSIDLSMIDQIRNYLSHFFRDRRIDTYGDLPKRYLDAD